MHASERLVETIVEKLTEGPAVLIDCWLIKIWASV